MARAFFPIIVLILATFGIAGSGLFAQWNPEYLDEKGEAPLAFEALQEPLFQSLKCRILQESVHGWCSQEKSALLMDLVLLKKPKVCVEIGAGTGSTVLPVASVLKYLGQGRVFAIDAWTNEIAVRNWEDNNPNKERWSKVDMRGMYKRFRTMLKERRLVNYCKTLSMTSEEAIGQISAPIDFLHCDGDPSEKSSLQDLELYLPKVRPGGYILLSGVCTMVDTQQPKMKAFFKLFETCDAVAEIDRDNAVLFRKR